MTCESLSSIRTLVSVTTCKWFYKANPDPITIIVFSWLNYNWVDPSGVLNWLMEVLYEAEINGEKVHIMSHIPPGNKDCLGAWGRNYARIIERYLSC